MSLEGWRPHNGEQGETAPRVWPEARKARGPGAEPLGAAREFAGQLYLVSETITRETSAVNAQTVAASQYVPSNTAQSSRPVRLCEPREQCVDIQGL